MPCCGMDVMKRFRIPTPRAAADIYICDACGSTEVMLAYETTVAALRLAAFPSQTPFLRPPGAPCRLSAARDRRQTDG